MWFKVQKIVAAASLLLAVSCSNMKQVVYFQDAKDGDIKQMAQAICVTAQPSDKLSIVVSSKDPELAAVFNLPVITHQIGTGQPSFSSSYNQVSSYTVNQAGDIDFPLLGTVHVGGLGRDEIASRIKTLIVERNLIKDPVVIVDFASMYVSVFGDVSKPGRVQIDKDRMTVLDVLSKAGDLNISGIRTIKLFREIDGSQHCYELDMTNSEELFTSPAYYVKQEDIVYVVPNRMKVRSSTVNGNTLLSASFWVSIGSLATTVATLIITATK